MIDLTDQDLSTSSLHIVHFAAKRPGRLAPAKERAAFRFPAWKFSSPAALGGKIATAKILCRCVCFCSLQRHRSTTVSFASNTGQNWSFGSYTGLRGQRSTSTKPEECFFKVIYICHIYIYTYCWFFSCCERGWNVLYSKQRFCSASFSLRVVLPWLRLLDVAVGPARCRGWLDGM